MARQLKRWESPRREGRNDKGRGGTARKRQRQKQLKNLAKKLKQQDNSYNDRQNKSTNPNCNSENCHRTQEGREPGFSSLFNWEFKYELNRQAKIQLANCYLRNLQPYLYPSQLG